MTAKRDEVRVSRPVGVNAELDRDCADSGPRCFMHIPKSGGVSIHTALESALPAESLAPQRFDTSVFCDFKDFDLLCPETRAEITVTKDEQKTLNTYRAVSGHFSLSTLSQIADPSSIATILREPRTRLISLYLYWRTPEIFERWNPYRADTHALRPLAEFLAEPRLAAMTDNQICRMLLHRDSRVPRANFIASADVEGIAKDAILRLDTLGFVGLLERGDSVWHGMAQMFGVRLDPIAANVTGGDLWPARARPGERLMAVDASDLIEERNAADLVVYEHALISAGLDSNQRHRMKERAFAQQLAKLYALVEPSRAPVHDRAGDVEI